MQGHGFRVLGTHQHQDHRASTPRIRIRVSGGMLMGTGSLSLGPFCPFVQGRCSRKRFGKTVELQRKPKRWVFTILAPVCLPASSSQANLFGTSQTHTRSYLG